jgi:hypothetical protein
MDKVSLPLPFSGFLDSLDSPYDPVFFVLAFKKHLYIQ